MPSRIKSINFVNFTIHHTLDSKKFFIFAASQIFCGLGTKINLIMRQIQIQVFASLDTKRENKVLFERICDISESLEVPYSSLVSNLKFMFGSSSIVSFNII